MEKVQAQIGNGIQGDEWNICEVLKEPGPDISDSLFPGCEFRIDAPGCPLNNLAVNIKITGKPHLSGFGWKSRCKIEVIGDGEPSTFFGGTLYHNHSYDTEPN